MWLGHLVAFLCPESIPRLLYHPASQTLGRHHLHVGHPGRYRASESFVSPCLHAQFDVAVRACARAARKAISYQISWLTDDCILLPFLGRYGQFHNTAVFDETLDNRLVFCVQLEVGTPILRPGGKENDLAANFLQ